MKSKKYMLSIIIPTYQEEKYIGRLLESIKKQTLQPDEIIVADNHSKDRTREIAKQYGCKVVDGGNPAQGRNAGAKAAKGDILLFLDSDTELTNSKFLEKLVASFQRRNLDIASTFISFDDINPKSIVANLTFNYTKITNELLLKHFNNVISESGACIIIRKRLFDTIGRFNERLGYSEDSEIFKRGTKYGARYGVIGLNVRTSSRRHKNMSTEELTITCLGGIYLFLRRFLGIPDDPEFLKQMEKFHGPLGGDVEKTNRLKE